MLNINSLMTGLLTVENINLAIKILAYALAFSGLMLIARKDIISFYRWQKEYQISKSNNVKVRKKESKMNRAIRRLLAATFKMDNSVSVFQFKIITTMIFAFFEIACVRQLNIMTATTIAVTMAAMPYVFLVLRLIQLRNKSSGEAEIVLSEFLTRYRINNYSIEETIESVLLSKSIKSTKPLLSKLLIKLRTTRSDSEILEATNVFAYTIGTHWAKMLASNIYQASKFGINITLSLEDILIHLREAKILKEERARNTAEPKRMMYFIPISYIFFFLVSTYVIGMDMQQYMNNQFNTKEGLMLFCICTIGTMISYLTLALINSKKLDF